MRRRRYSFQIIPPSLQCIAPLNLHSSIHARVHTSKRQTEKQMIESTSE